ncbi:MAG: delta(1)-pyrroline-2-carboxylate reductase family protein [Burkholderiales bacterium]|nr:delta(1)-pyrroline-2-carboxylate reductase family protein [Burkholderiales bacterium]
MKILDRTKTIEALPYAKLVPAVALAAKELATGAIIAPERQVVSINSNSFLLNMPAIGKGISVSKLITVHAQNAQHGLPAIQGEVIVFETETGQRLMLLDGPTVTARRTAAMTLLGIQTLAPKTPSSALLIGTGTQAAAHADALVEYFGVKDLLVAGSTINKAESFCKALLDRHPDLCAHPLPADQLQHRALETDVVVALTTSKSPVIPIHIAPHTLAIGVGAYRPDMAEFPPELLRQRQVVVDDLEGARHEAGDLLQADIDWSTVLNLGAVLSGQSLRYAQVPVFKTVGQAAWDLAAARVAVAESR